MTTNYGGILLTASLAVSLSLPGGYSLASAILVLAGLVCLSLRLLKRAPLLETSLAGNLPLIFFAFAVIGALLSFWQGEPSGHYELYIPFLWAPLIFLAVRDGQIDRRFVWLGCLLGAAGACVIAMYQSFYLGVERPSGFLTSPIFFGNNALLLGSVALAGRHDPPFNLPARVWLGLTYFGFLLGFAASLVTLSKGGWPFAVIAFSWVVIEDFWGATKRTRFSIILLAIAFASLLPLLPANRIADRITDAATGAKEWFRTGEMVEGSVSPRLELWKFGLTIWPEKPWLGHTREGVTARIQENALLDDKRAEIGDVGALHSEPIQLLAEKGLVGFSSWFLMYVVSYLTFWRAYSAAGPVKKGLGQAGLVVLTGSLVFGLSDTYLMWSANRQIFVLLVMLFAALLSVKGSNRA